MEVFVKDQHDGVSSETNLQAIDFNGYGDCGLVELKEQDLIKQLEEKRSNNGDSGSVVDCTLTLGPSGFGLRQMDCSNNARNEESLYVPTNCHSSSPQATTGIGSSSWNGYSGRLPTSDFFAAYANSLVVDANGCTTPTDFHVIPKFVLKNRPESSFFQSKENAGDGRKEGITTVRKCFFCQTTSTPLWRNGPKGSKSLCNACGIRYKKEERKALAAAAAAAAAVGSRSDIGGGREDDNRAQQCARKST